jgi:hypothetical protein
LNDWTKKWNGLDVANNWFRHSGFDCTFASALKVKVVQKSGFCQNALTNSSSRVPGSFQCQSLKYVGMNMPFAAYIQFLKSVSAAFYVPT